MSDVKGRKIEVSEDFIEKQKKYIAKYPSYNRVATAFERAGVKIK